jgi:chemotaxis regulatin CheY-phosphate phosphatase CheZ
MHPMTQAQPDRLDRLEALVERNSTAIENLTSKVDRISDEVDKLREESKELGIRFGYYQQSTSAIVNLAFSLIASATVSIFITVVLKR